MSDNRGRGDVGDINFKLQVPVNSSVDLETRRGNISVANIRSGLVRAHVSSEGDIELTNITATQVVAQNVIGNIFFDGEFSSGGTYEFKSNKGDITIRIPGDSAFRLVAASPARKIALNDFWNNDFKTQDGRKYVGDVGDGRSSVSVINFSGQITFLAKISLRSSNGKLGLRTLHQATSFFCFRMPAKRRYYCGDDQMRKSSFHPAILLRFC